MLSGYLSNSYATPLYFLHRIKFVNDNIVVEETEHKLTLRQLEREDYADITSIMSSVYGEKWPLSEKKFFIQLDAFSGRDRFCIEDHGTVIAAAFSVIVDYDDFGDHHTYDEITGRSLSDPPMIRKVMCYMALMYFVSPDYHGMRLGRRLYEARKELCQSLNLKSIIAGGRIPNYKDHAQQLTPQQYIEQVKRKEIYDPILTFQLSNEFEVKRVLKGYLPDDKESLGYATLLEWSNLYYDPEKTPLIGADRTNARIGLVQWQMRPLKSVAELIQQVEYFIDALSDYQCDMALLPEFFSAPLMGIDSHENVHRCSSGIGRFQHRNNRRNIQAGRVIQYKYYCRLITGNRW